MAGCYLNYILNFRLKIIFGLILLFLFISTANTLAASDISPREAGYISAPSSSLDGIKPEACWIWDSGDTNPKNYYLHVRKTFVLDSSPSHAAAYISANSFADLYINGKYIERVPVKSDPQYQVYDYFDLTPFLKKGENTIAALVHNYGVGMHHHINARGGFFFQGQITDTKGNTTRLNSDKSWRVSNAKAWDSSTKQRHVNHLIGFREKYDARKAFTGWLNFSFDDSQWQPANEIGIPPVAPWNGIIVIKRPFLRIENIKPVTSWQSNGYTVYDFGKVYSAFPQFTIDSKQSGIQFNFGTAERLAPDKMPKMTQELDYTDSYITSLGIQTWKPVTWRSFRYLAIENKQQVEIKNADAVFRSYPVDYRGSFSCSDSDLTEYWKVGRWTLQICSQDTLMDTPWREQTQYIAGDSRFDMRYGNYAFGPEVEYLFKYNILSGAFSQRWKDDGSIRSRYPTDWLLGPHTSTYIPDYQLEWVLMAHEYYMYYADDNLISQIYPNLKKLMAYFEDYISKDYNLLTRVPGWVVLDHPDTYRMDVDGINTAMNSLYYGALNSASWLAKNVMDDSDTADHWLTQADSIKNAVNTYLFSANDGVYKDGLESSRLTQQTQVYALKYNLVPSDKKARVIDFIKSKDRSCEQSFSYWLLNTMFSEGQGQWSLDYIRTYWGEQFGSKDFNGAWHEGWNCDWGSTSHAWCSGPTALLPEKALGVEPVSPGWKKFCIKPRLADLKWAQGIIPTISGDIYVKLQSINEAGKTGIKINTVIPVKTISLVYVPIEQNEKSEIHINGKLIWQDGTFFEIDDNISYQHKAKDYVLFEILPGSYDIISQSH